MKRVTQANVFETNFILLLLIGDTKATEKLNYITVENRKGGEDGLWKGMQQVAAGKDADGERWGGKGCKESHRRRREWVRNLWEKEPAISHCLACRLLTIKIFMYQARRSFYSTALLFSSIFFYRSFHCCLPVATAVVDLPDFLKPLIDFICYFIASVISLSLFYYFMFTSFILCCFCGHLKWNFTLQTRGILVSHSLLDTVGPG